jgi:hypothetical protein
VPVYFLAFPRFVEDGEYLFRVLRPVLPSTTTPNEANSAHLRTADRAKVRVEAEVANIERDSGAAAYHAGISVKPEEVDTIALRRELVRLRAELQAGSANAQRSEAEASELRSKLLAATEAARRSEAAAEEETARLRKSLSSETARAEEARGEVVALLESRTWRMTAPIRALVSVMKGRNRI